MRRLVGQRCCRPGRWLMEFRAAGRATMCRFAALFCSSGQRGPSCNNKDITFSCDCTSPKHRILRLRWCMTRALCLTPVQLAHPIHAMSDNLTDSLGSPCYQGEPHLTALALRVEVQNNRMANRTTREKPVNLDLALCLSHHVSRCAFAFFEFSARPPCFPRLLQNSC